jgi:hypothetical protein
MNVKDYIKKEIKGLGKDFMIAVRLMAFALILPLYAAITFTFFSDIKSGKYGDTFSLEMVKKDRPAAIAKALDLPKAGPLVDASR